MLSSSHPHRPLSEFRLFCILVNTWDYQGLFFPIPKGSDMISFCCFILTKPRPLRAGGSKRSSGSALSLEDRRPTVQAREISQPKSPSREGQHCHLNAVLRASRAELFRLPQRIQLCRPTGQTRPQTTCVRAALTNYLL